MTSKRIMVKYTISMILGGGHIGFMQIRVKGGSLSLCPHLKCLISSLSTFMPKDMLVLKNAVYPSLGSLSRTTNNTCVKNMSYMRHMCVIHTLWSTHDILVTHRVLKIIYLNSATQKMVYCSSLSM